MYCRLLVNVNEACNNLAKVENFPFSSAKRDQLLDFHSIKMQKQLKTHNLLAAKQLIPPLIVAIPFKGLFQDYVAHMR